MAVHYESIYGMHGGDYTDLKFFEIGYQKCEPGYSYGPIIRDKHILHYILQGDGHLELDKHKYPVSPKQVFFIPAGCPGSYQASVDNPWHYIWIIFHGPIGDEIMEKLGLCKYHPVFSPIGYPNADTDILEQLLFQILEKSQQEYACLGRLYLFFEEMLTLSDYRQQPVKARISPLHYTDMVMKYISEKYSEPVHVQDIADYLGLDRSYLGKIFKQATGLTPQQYLMEFRISRAKELLLNTDMPIQHVSYSVGYNDPLAFSKVFRQESGMSPSTFRQACR